MIQVLKKLELPLKLIHATITQKYRNAVSSRTTKSRGALMKITLTLLLTVCLSGFQCSNAMELTEEQFERQCKELGYTPLSWLLMHDNFERAKTYILKKKYINEPSRIGGTPLMLAVSSHAENKIDIIRLLLQAGADPNLTEEEGGLTPLRSAIHWGSLDIVKLLIEFLADPNKRTKDATPLMVAACQNREEIVKLLLEHGADPNLEDNKKQKAYHWALSEGNRKVAQLLQPYTTGIPKTIVKSVPKPAFDFDRDEVIDAEGYWALSVDPKKDIYKGKYPFPKANAKPWAGKEEFLKKLEKIEAFASRDENAKIRINVFRGPAMSRLDSGIVGCTEYVDTVNSMKWTEGFGSHYIGKHNVKPSREFYEYVMTFGD